MTTRPLSPEAAKLLEGFAKKNESESEREGILDRLLNSNKQLENISSQQIVFSPAWLSMGDIPIIAKGTINLIQGKAGSHKSRLSEVFCAVLLGQKPILNFSRYKSAGYCVAYIDTERNCIEDFPAAIQRVRTLAGMTGTQQSSNFYPVSIKQETRENRLQAVKTWIGYVQEDMKDRGVSDWNLFVVLDVVTDCARSFNNDTDSLALFDYVGNLCEQTGAAFLLLLHENPGTEKARGHIGTEGLNKANTQIQIGYERGESGEDTDIIKLKFLKTRNAKKPEPVYLQFSQIEKTLVLADKERLKEVLSEKTKAGNLEVAAEAVGRVFAGRGEVKHKEMISGLIEELGISDRTARIRISDIITGSVPVNNAGTVGTIHAVVQRGKETTYLFTLPTLPGKPGEQPESPVFSEDLPF